MEALDNFNASMLPIIHKLISILAALLFVDGDNRTYFFLIEKVENILKK